MTSDFVKIICRFDVFLLYPQIGHSKESKADVAEMVAEVSVLLHVLWEAGLVKGYDQAMRKNSSLWWALLYPDHKVSLD